MLKTEHGRLAIEGNTYKEFTGAKLSLIREELSDDEIEQLLRVKFGIFNLDPLEAKNG